LTGHAVASASDPRHRRRQRLDLTAELRERFNRKRPEDLSLTEASQLIDEFKAATNGGSR
jgi:hypothetical protein